MIPDVKPLHMWQVQAQLTGILQGGWQSSRQVPTMIVGATDGTTAVRAVSDMAWNMSTDRGHAGPVHTFATVARVNPRTGYVSATVAWVRVTYRWGSIETVAANTYAEVKIDEGAV